MGTITRRGTRAKPRFYASYREATGKWVMRALPGISTRDAAKKALATIEANVLAGRLGIAPQRIAVSFASRAEAWIPTLRNRARAKDVGRMRNHVLPWFGAMSLDQAAKREEVVKWLDHQRALGTLKEGSIRGNLVVLGSFWTWLVERGEAATNPVSALPRSAKPRRQTRQVHTPWIQSDTDVIHIMDLLDVPARYAFYLANRSGLRPGEICGLRVQDLAEAEAGIIVVRFNFSGPLKEDKAGDGKSKVVPAPADITEVMGSYLAARRAEAKPSDPLFVYTPTAGRPRKDDWRGMTYDYLKTSWARVRAATGLTLTWYQATRHSFVSRSLAAGATYDEVSAAVGHSSVLITKAAYDHFERRQFSAITRAGLNREEK